MPEAEQGMNVARIRFVARRIASGSIGAHHQPFLLVGMQAIAMAAERIMSGGAEAIVAGGTESMSMIPMGGHKVRRTPGWSTTILTLI